MSETLNIRLNYYVAYPEGDNYERLGMNGGFMGAITYDYDKNSRQVKIKFDRGSKPFSLAFVALVCLFCL